MKVPQPIAVLHPWGAWNMAITPGLHGCQGLFRDEFPFVERFEKRDHVPGCRYNSPIGPVLPARSDVRNVLVIVKDIRWGHRCTDLWSGIADQPGMLES